MKSAALSLAFSSAVILCALPVIAAAQVPERLTRPRESTIGADGKLHAPADATMGNLIVDTYSSLGAVVSRPEGPPEGVASGLKSVTCQGATGPLVAYKVRELLKTTSKADRMRLKSRDAAGLTEFSIRLVAGLDDASVEAIRADEALGPGAYHNAIGGFRWALDVCGFFGEERKL